MVAGREKPSQLTDEDKEIINKIVIVCAALMSVVIREYTPKQFAKKYILSNSRKQNSFAHLLLNVANKTKDRLYSPRELNREQSESFDTEQQNDNDITAPRKYISSSHMSENLRLLEVLGAYEKITNKREIKRRERREARDDRGGRPSRFQITANIENIKYIMTKPEACDLLKNRLTQLKTFFEYQKLVLLALFYALKKDKTISSRLFGILFWLPSGSVKEFETLIGFLSSLDEDQFLYYTALATQKIIENQTFDKWFIIKLFFPFL